MDDTDDVKRPDRDEGVAPTPDRSGTDSKACPADLPREIGGRKGPEPVRYGDWEKNGRCIDF